MTGWLLDTLLATSALSLLVLLVREPVRKRFGSRVTYGLWLIPAARLFMPTLTHTVERAVPAAITIQPLPEPLVRESLWMARVTPADASLLDRIGGWPTILVAAWLVVAAGLFVSRLVAFRRDRRAILRQSVEVSRLGSVRVISTPELGSPVALGIFDRIIAVPRDFERRYGEQERQLVLQHELAHHQSGDLIANLFAFVLLCLQWFNPLAWVAHAAFRFDQEAACDARVLDKATAADRADYGRAIAKAASGRALLFASALDRPSSLQRRLQSMLRSPSPTRRIAGRLMVVAAVGIALPLTASRAIEYVDVPVAPETPHVVPAVAPAPRAIAPAAPLVASVAPTAVPAAPAPARLVHPAALAAPAQTTSRLEDEESLTINDDLVTINGKTKRWEELTPAEKARVSAAVAKARAALANTHIDQAKILRDLASIPDPARIQQLQMNLARTQANLAETVLRMRERAAAARASGRDPDQLEAAIQATLESARSVDLQNAARALAGIDRAKIAADVSGAQQSMEKAKAELARIQARIDADKHQ